VALIYGAGVAMVALTLVGDTIDTTGCIRGVGVADTVGQLIAVVLLTYVTKVTTRLDKEVRNGGE
jgi:hypothetical protein